MDYFGHSVDGQNPSPFLLILDFAPRAPNLILAGRGATRRSADWPKSCTPRAQPTNIESGAGGREEVCADAPRARVLQDFMEMGKVEISRNLLEVWSPRARESLQFLVETGGGDK